MENSVFEAIYIAVSTLVFVAAISAGIALMVAVQDTADIAIEKMDTLDYSVIRTPLEYDPSTGLNTSNLKDITIIKGNEIIATYVESIKKNWVNKNYEFQIYVTGRGYVPLDKNNIRNVVATKDYKRTVEPTVKLINYDKGYEINKIVIKYKQEG